MKKILIALFVLCSLSSFSQGVSVSYLFPKNGYLAPPVSPFSLRGIGFGETFGVQTGFTLYNIPGLAMEKLPFTYNEPLVGPHFALLAPLEGFVSIPIDVVRINLTAGGFGWWNINTRLNEGNMDRAFRKHEGWDVANTDLELQDNIGFGWMGGLELEVRVVSNVFVTLEGKYLKGAAKTELTGTYIGGTTSGPLQTKAVDIDDAEINLEGFEVSLGVKIGE